MVEQDKTGAQDQANGATDHEARDADFSKLGEEAGDQAGSARTASEVDVLKAAVEEQKDKYLRALADFENYKKRALKDRAELLKYQGERAFADLLEVVDDFELALQHAEGDPAQFRTGVEMIHKKLVDTLGKWEVRSEPAEGKDFDPNKHRALSKVAVDDTKPGTIIKEMRKTYFYKDKLLRPGEVVVAAERAEGVA